MNSEKTKTDSSSILRRGVWLGLLLMAVVNCRPHRHADGTEHRGCGGCAGAHSHEGEVGSHSHATGHSAHAPSVEKPTFSVWRYTSKMEFFLEYSPLVAGTSSHVVAHVTILGNSFRAVEAGSLELVFWQKGMEIEKWTAPKVTRVGIFKPSGRVPMAGTYQLVLTVKSVQGDDSLLLSPVVVYQQKSVANKAAQAAAGESGEFSFSKEQQWQISFATQTQIQRVLQDSISVVGELTPVPGQWASLAAPVAGTITAVATGLQEGKDVKKGQFLLRIEPQLMLQEDWPSLQKEAAQAKAQWEQAGWRVERLRRMARDRAVAQWELKQALSLQSQQKARWLAAQERLSLFLKSRKQRTDRIHAISMTAPLGGVLLRYNAVWGGFVSAGQMLVEIARIDSLQLVAYLPEDQGHRWREIQGATVLCANRGWITLQKPVAVGARILSDTRTFPLFFSVKQPGHWRVGQKLPARLLLPSRRTWAIPESAILDDRGYSAVLVQVTGESFAQKRVTLGIRDRGWVEIRAGLEKGDRIVTLGAYDIVLSHALKQSGGAGHGHAH